MGKMSRRRRRCCVYVIQAAIQQRNERHPIAYQRRLMFAWNSARRRRRGCVCLNSAQWRWRLSEQPGEAGGAGRQLACFPVLPTLLRVATPARVPSRFSHSHSSSSLHPPKLLRARPLACFVILYRHKKGCRLERAESTLSLRNALIKRHKKGRQKRDPRYCRSASTRISSRESRHVCVCVDLCAAMSAAAATATMTKEGGTSLAPRQKPPPRAESAPLRRRRLRWWPVSTSRARGQRKD